MSEVHHCSQYIAASLLLFAEFLQQESLFSFLLNKHTDAQFIEQVYAASHISVQLDIQQQAA